MSSKIALGWIIVLGVAGFMSTALSAEPECRFDKNAIQRSSNGDLIEVRLGLLNYEIGVLPANELLIVFSKDGKCMSHDAVRIHLGPLTEAEHIADSILEHMIHFQFENRDILLDLKKARLGKLLGRIVTYNMFGGSRAQMDIWAPMFASTVVNPPNGGETQLRMYTGSLRGKQLAGLISLEIPERRTIEESITESQNERIRRAIQKLAQKRASGMSDEDLAKDVSLVGIQVSK